MQKTTFKTVKREAVPGEKILVTKPFCNQNDIFGTYSKGDVLRVVWRGSVGVKTLNGDILLDDEYRVIEGTRPATCWERFKWKVVTFFS